MGGTAATSKCSSLSLSLSLSVVSLSSALGGSGLPLSANLSGVATLAGVGSFLLLSFLDVTGFALSGVVFCDWFCCATAKGIVSMAKSRTIKILIFVSGRKELDQHYKGCLLLHLEKPRPRSRISLARDNHITISGSSCAQRTFKGASEYEKSTRVAVRHCSLRLDVVFCLCSR